MVISPGESGGSEGGTVWGSSRNGRMFVLLLENGPLGFSEGWRKAQC